MRGVRISVAVAWTIIAVVAVAAFFPGLLAHQSPIEGDVVHKLSAPSADHWFGTDYLGRDVWSRVVHGTSVSLRATVIAVAIAFGVGSLLGLVAGYVGGRVDAVIMRVVDVMLAIPTLLLSLAIVAALGFGATNVAVAVGVASIASFARLTRSEVLRIRTMSYVEAASALGVTRTGVLARHVLPNAIGPALVLSALEFGSAILAVSALSFLGYGEPPPAPEWGKVVAEGRDYLAVAWWTVLLPSLVISAVALSANRLSRAYDDRGAPTS